MTDAGMGMVDKRMLSKTNIPANTDRDVKIIN